jgi:hypothetical protein
MFFVMLQLHNLLVSKWPQNKYLESGKDFMLTLYISLLGNVEVIYNYLN